MSSFLLYLNLIYRDILKKIEKFILKYIIINIVYWVIRFYYFYFLHNLVILKIALILI